MKTAMQILISELKDGLAQDEIKVSPKELLQNLIWRCEGLLKKEKEIICNAFSDAQHGAVESRWTAEEYFEETFNTKENG